MMDGSVDLLAVWLTLKLAFLTVIILLIICLPSAWFLSRYQGRFKPIIEALITLPLVLPPTVLGFYLLIAFSPDTWFGALWLQTTGNQLVFSFTGILIGSLIYSLPFVMQPLLSGLSQLGKEFDAQEASMGIVKWKRFVCLLLPLFKPRIISAATVGFAHTIGAFGFVLMIGGNIPGETQVLSIEVSNHV